MTDSRRITIGGVDGEGDTNKGEHYAYSGWADFPKCGGVQIVGTPTGFGLSPGATVDMQNVSQTFSKKQGAKRKRTKTKRKK